MTNTLSEARAAWRNAQADGCTLSPELWYHRCCLNHDRAYTTGTDQAGHQITRAEADRRLYRCMAHKGRGWPLRGRLIPAIYYLAVRLFGSRRWQPPAIPPNGTDDA
jgi:hypothetical protein